MTRIIIHFVVGTLLIAAEAAAGGEGALAQPPTIIPHPALEPAAGPTTAHQLGAFGESVVHAGLVARGFEVIDGNVGASGIDRIAVKRAANGRLVDVRFVEVKTRQGAAGFDLARTENNGRQLSDAWTRNHLRRIAADHPDPHVRGLAREIVAEAQVRPEIVRRELHGIALGPDRYVVMNVDEAGRVSGVAAEGRLTELLKMLSARGTSVATRAAAARHLFGFQQLRAAGAPGTNRQVGPAPTPLRTPHLRNVDRTAVPRVGKRATAGGAARSEIVVVEGPAAAKGWIAAIASRPGVLGAAATFAADEAAVGWQYYQGSISAADFQRRTLQNGVEAAAVGVATQVVYLLAPTPHGLALIAVGVVAYVAVDQAVASYDRAFVPEAPAAAELRGIVPEGAIATLTLEDVAIGRAARAAHGR